MGLGCGGMHLNARSVALVYGDVEAGLTKLFFNIQLAGFLQGAEMDAHPVDFVRGEIALGDVDGGARDVRAYNVTLGTGGVAVAQSKFLLILNGADGGADLERPMEDCLVGAREIR